MDYVLSQHAQKQLTEFGRQNIEQEWIARTLTSPDYSDTDPRTQARRAWKRIPEYDNRALRVVYTDTSPIIVITVFFDRRFKDEAR